MSRKKKLKKTNEERVLDQHHLEYTEYQFDWIHKGEDALKEAEAAGMPANSLLKTIVLQANNDPKDYLVVCLPLEFEIDLKKVAHELDKKQVHLADNKNLINITGYVHGANTPIGISFKEGFPIYFDERVKEFEEVSVSAGKVGRSVRLKLDDLMKLVNGKFLQVER